MIRRIDINTKDLDTFAHAWLVYFWEEFGQLDPGDNEWANDLLKDAERYDPDLCYKLVMAILEKDTSREVVAYLAAGPVEDMLAYNGDRAIVILENHPHRNALFCRLLYGVWRNSTREDIWERFERLRESLPLTDEPEE